MEPPIEPGVRNSRGEHTVSLGSLLDMYTSFPDPDRSVRTVTGRHDGFRHPTAHSGPHLEYKHQSAAAAMAAISSSAAAESIPVADFDDAENKSVKATPTLKNSLGGTMG
jgi:hypothetical protein